MIYLNHFKRKSLIRAISTALLLAFFFQEISYADPDLKPLEWNKKEDFRDWAKSILPSFPESVATLEDAWKSPDSKKTLILIQDAHTNTSGQFNVAKTLDLLLSFSARGGPAFGGRAGEKSPQYVFLEAGSGNQSLSFLRQYADPKKRKRIAESFLRQGKLQGSELTDLTTEHDFILWGVEDLKLYAQSVETYRSVAKERDKFQDYLCRIESTIKILKARIYNPILQSFDEKYQRFSAESGSASGGKKEEIPLTEYFDILLNQAKASNIKLNAYPHLRHLDKLKKLESKIDFQKASQEEQTAISSLSEEDRKELMGQQSPSKLGAANNQVQKAFFATLESVISSPAGWQDEKSPLFRRRTDPPLAENAEISQSSRHSTGLLRNDNNAYPELFKYFRYLKEAGKLEAKELLNEQKSLEKEVFRSLITGPDEENLLKASHNLKSLKKLLNLTLTPDEFEEYLKDKQSFDIKKITGFLNKKIMDLKSLYENAVFLEDGYEDIIQKCEAFYSLTTQRDQKFLENLVPIMDKENQDKAILITGGYHSPNLKYLLKQQNISYICLTPQILHETDWKRYETLLFEQNTSLFKSSAAVIRHSLSMNQLPQVIQRAESGSPRDLYDLTRAITPTLTAARLADSSGTIPNQLLAVLDNPPGNLGLALVTRDPRELAGEFTFRLLKEENLKALVETKQFIDRYYPRGQKTGVTEVHPIGEINRLAIQDPWRALARVLLESFLDPDVARKYNQFTRRRQLLGIFARAAAQAIVGPLMGPEAEAAAKRFFASANPWDAVALQLSQNPEAYHAFEDRLGNLTQSTVSIGQRYTHVMTQEFGEMVEFLRRKPQALSPDALPLDDAKKLVRKYMDFIERNILELPDFFTSFGNFFINNPWDFSQNFEIRVNLLRQDFDRLLRSPMKPEQSLVDKVTERFQSDPEAAQRALSAALEDLAQTIFERDVFNLLKNFKGLPQNIKGLFRDHPSLRKFRRTRLEIRRRTRDEQAHTRQGAERQKAQPTEPDTSMAGIGEDDPVVETIQVLRSLRDKLLDRHFIATLYRDSPEIQEQAMHYQWLLNVDVSIVRLPEQLLTQQREMVVRRLTKEVWERLPKSIRSEKSYSFSATAEERERWRVFYFDAYWPTALPYAEIHEAITSIMFELDPKVQDQHSREEKLYFIEQQHAKAYDDIMKITGGSVFEKGNKSYARKHARIFAEDIVDPLLRIGALGPGKIFLDPLAGDGTPGRVVHELTGANAINIEKEKVIFDAGIVASWRMGKIDWIHGVFQEHRDVIQKADVIYAYTPTNGREQVIFAQDIVPHMKVGAILTGDLKVTDDLKPFLEPVLDPETGEIIGQRRRLEARTDDDTDGLNAARLAAEGEKPDQSSIIEGNAASFINMRVRGDLTPLLDRERLDPSDSDGDIENPNALAGAFMLGMTFDKLVTERLSSSRRSAQLSKPQIPQEEPEKEPIHVPIKPPKPIPRPAPAPQPAKPAPAPRRETVPAGQAVGNGVRSLHLTNPLDFLEGVESRDLTLFSQNEPDEHLRSYVNERFAAQLAEFSKIMGQISSWLHVLLSWLHHIEHFLSIAVHVVRERLDPSVDMRVRRDLTPLLTPLPLPGSIAVVPPNDSLAERRDGGARLASINLITRWISRFKSQKPLIKPQPFFVERPEHVEMYDWFVKELSEALGPDILERSVLIHVDFHPDNQSNSIIERDGPLTSGSVIFHLKKLFKEIWWVVSEGFGFPLEASKQLELLENLPRGDSSQFRNIVEQFKKVRPNFISDLWDILTFNKFRVMGQELPLTTDPVILSIDLDAFHSREEYKVPIETVYRRIDDFIGTLASRKYNVVGIFVADSPEFTPAPHMDLIRQRLIASLSTLYSLQMLPSAARLALEGPNLPLPASQDQHEFSESDEGMSSIHGAPSFNGKAEPTPDAARLAVEGEKPDQSSVPEDNAAGFINRRVRGDLTSLFKLGARLAGREDYSVKNAGPDFWRMIRPLSLLKGTFSSRSLTAAMTVSAIGGWIRTWRMSYFFGGYIERLVRSLSSDMNNRPSFLDRSALEKSEADFSTRMASWPKSFKAEIKRMGTSSSTRNFIEEFKRISRRGILGSWRTPRQSVRLLLRARSSGQGNNQGRLSLERAAPPPKAPTRHKRESDVPESTVSHAGPADPHLYTVQSNYPLTTPRRKYSTPYSKIQFAARLAKLSDNASVATKLGLVLNSSHVDLSEHKLFFANIARTIAVRTASKNIALAEDLDQVKVYSLTRNGNILIVEGLSPERLEINLKEEALLQRSKESKLTFEKDLTDDLRDILKANGISSLVSLTNSPRKFFIHLNGLRHPSDKLTRQVISNLLIQWNHCIGPNTAVILKGDEALLKVADEAIRAHSLKTYQFFKDVPDHLKGEDIPEAHLVREGSLEATKPNYSDQAHWITLKKDTDPLKEAGVFSFGAIETILDLLVQGDYQRAFSLFKDLNPDYADIITYEEFLLLIKGDLETTAKYPYMPLMRVNFQEALKLYLLSRITGYSA